MRVTHWLTIISCLNIFVVSGQPINDSTGDVAKLGKNYIADISAKSQRIESQIDHQTDKYLKGLLKAENRLKCKLFIIDSFTAKTVFQNNGHQYTALLDKIKNKVDPAALKNSGLYLPYMDSVKGSLSFLQQNNIASHLLHSADINKLGPVINELGQLQGKFQQAEVIKQFIAERKQIIKDVLSRYSDLPRTVTNCYDAYSKQAYYYAAQVREYKEMLNDPDRIERKALALLSKLPAFQAFMEQHSQLAGLFNLPGSYADVGALTGLQTKSQVQQLITNQMGGSTNAGQMFGQQIQAASKQLDAFKSKLSQLSGASGDIEMPDFKPNQQKTRPFLYRLEYGINLQTQRSTYFFPTTTDLSLSVGYKLTNKNVIGIGMSYKVGYGKDIQHISITSQGVGLRSFIDMQVHKTFYASGGLEYNFQQPFSSFQEIRSISSWSQSGLIGISKIVSMKTKIFKKAKMQVLWDFLSYYQRPVQPAFKFRVGYTF